MFSNKTAALMLLVGLTTRIAGCDDTSQKDRLANAQLCMDKATDASSASACVSAIQDIQSAEASSLRCAADFIGANIVTPDNLSNALNAIKNSNSSATMLSYLSFASTSAVNTAVTDCNLSGSEGYVLLSGLAQTATYVASTLGTFGNGTQPTESDILTAINNVVSNPNTASSQAVIQTAGTAIQTVYTTTCGSSGANTTICSSLESGAQQAGIDLTTATPTQIGDALLNYWKSGTH